MRRLTRALPELDLKTKLLLMMLSLLLLASASLFFLHLFSENRLLSQVRDYTDELSTAIDVAQEQPASEGDPHAALAAYVEKLRKLGLKDVTLTDTATEVQASTNPDIVGKRLVRKKKGDPVYVVKGILGDPAGPQQKTATLRIPLLVGDRKVGYLAVTRSLDDLSELSQEAFLSRLLATLAVFSVGMVLSLYLSWSFSKPIGALSDAAEKVAAGDLSAHVAPAGGGELASLSRTFNTMVEKLREQRSLEEQLHFAERATAIGRLASAVAHEIRNPLNMINLSIDHARGRLAPSEPERREEFDRVLSNMKEEIVRLNRLVSDFLSFGKPMRLDRRECAVGDVVRAVSALVEHKARDQGINVKVSIEDGLPDLVADRELLKNCLLNLMINAVDAMPSGGTLEMSVGRGHNGDRPKGVEVSVIDTGLGMTPAQVDAAFEPYFSTKDTGLGLGLALTRKIVEDHGGEITLDSTPGRGTVARIFLPETVATPSGAAR
jgi:signal transduction histidine kinase